MTTIDLTYDSVMDMVRPEVPLGIHVHRKLQVTLAEGNQASETRERQVKGASDQNAMRHVLGATNDEGNCAVWHVVGKEQLMRVQRDPQSTRTMIVTLTSPTTCSLEVKDELRPGCSEYAFMRVSQQTLGYFSSYQVTNTSCAIH